WCQRRYNIRMQELNLVQLAKDGFWQSEIQGILHLYANKDAKRLASKLYRQGKSEFLGEHLSKLAATEAWNGEFHEGTARQHMSESEPDDSDDTVDLEDGEESLLTPEEQSIRLPPLTPLFSPEVEKQQHI